MPEHISPSCSLARAKLAELRVHKEVFEKAYNALHVQEAPSEEAIAHVRFLKQELIKSMHTLNEYAFFEKLRSQEQEILSRFFEQTIEVPPLPKEITLERIKAWEEKRLALHYLPEMDMRKFLNKDGTSKLKEWKKVLIYSEYFDRSTLRSDNFLLKGGWILLDSRKKPVRDTVYEYDEDFLAPILTELNKKGIIEQRRSTRGDLLPPSSRFGLSPNELSKPEVIHALAEASNLSPSELALPRSIEMNILSHLHHTYDSATSGCEWFADSYNGFSISPVMGRMPCSARLFGEASFHKISWGGLNNHDDEIGFRILGRFSS